MDSSTTAPVPINTRRRKKCIYKYTYISISISISISAPCILPQPSRRQEGGAPQCVVKDNGVQSRGQKKMMMKRTLGENLRRLCVNLNMQMDQKMSTERQKM